MSTPLVSVVIPSFNHAKYVVEAVDSVLAQTNCRVEVIVVDDGSSDNTREVLASYGDRIRYIYQENKGLPGARNTGIKAATGEWVAVLDSDDYWHPQKTERQLQAAEQHPEADIIGSPSGDLELPAEIPPNPPTRWLGVRDFLLVAPTSASSTMIRRRCFDEVGLFDETLRSAEDRDMWLRLAARFKVLQVVMSCWHYRVHPGQMSHNAKRMYDNFLKVLVKFFTEHPDQSSLKPMAFGFLYQDAAVCYSDAGNRLAAIWYIVRSIVRYPKALNNGRFGRAKLLIRFVVGQSVLSLVKRVIGGRSKLPVATNTKLSAHSQPESSRERAESIP